MDFILQALYEMGGNCAFQFSVTYLHNTAQNLNATVSYLYAMLIILNTSALSKKSLCQYKSHLISGPLIAHKSSDNVYGGIIVVVNTKGKHT